MAAKRQTKQKPAAAPVPIKAAVEDQADPLRARLYGMTERQEAEIRRRLMGLIIKSLADMSTGRVQDVAQFVYLVLGAEGCTTPTEEFIISLVGRHYYHPLTPDDVIWCVEGDFRDNFNSDIGTTRRFNSQYPELVAAEPEPRAAAD